jgi:hypothetical protein
MVKGRPLMIKNGPDVVFSYGSYHFLGKLVRSNRFEQDGVEILVDTHTAWIIYDLLGDDYIEINDDLDQHPLEKHAEPLTEVELN